MGDNLSWLEMTTWILEQNLDLASQVDQLKVKNAALMKQQKILEEEIQKLLGQWRCEQFGRKKPFTVFFGCWKTCAFLIFFLKKNHVENPNPFFSPFFFLSLNEVVGKTCYTPTKKSQSFGHRCVIFGGEAAHHFYHSFSVDIFWGWDDEKAPHILSESYNPSGKIELSAGFGKMSQPGCFGPFMTQRFDGAFDGQYNNSPRN